MQKRFVIFGILLLLLIPFIHADIAPFGYDSASLNFLVKYDNQPIEENFMADILICLEESCTEIDNTDECEKGECSFYYYRIERVPSEMKLQVNIDDKTFTSGTFSFSEKPSLYRYYYDVNINPDGKMTITDDNGEIEQSDSYPFEETSVEGTWWESYYPVLRLFVCALALTILIELIVLIIFLKRWKVKGWKRPILSLVIADVISVPLVWIIFFAILIMLTLFLQLSSIVIAFIFAEAFAVVFEAYFIYWFNKKIISLKRLFILSIVMNIASLIIGGIILAVLSSMLLYPYGAEQPNNYETGQPNTIQVFVDEDAKDPKNLKKIHLADIYVVNGELSLKILDNTRDLERQMLEKTFDEIKSKETLPLTVEPELGLLQVVDIPKNSSDYIHAVAENLYFETNIVRTQISLPCIIAGEDMPLPSETEGLNVECCEGLITIPPSFPSTNPEEHISSLPEGCGISVGPMPICSDCGNGICESWENKCNCHEDCTEDSLTEDYYIHGAIGVGFKKGTTQQEAETVLKKYGLTFVKTDDLNLGKRFFYDSGEKFRVNTGEGNEDYWISVLQKEEKVYDASWLPDPDKVLVD